LRRNFPIPLLVVADIAAEIADGRIGARNRFDLLGRYDEQVVLRALALAFIARRCTWLTCRGPSCSFVKNALNRLCLSDVDVALGRSLDDLCTYISTLTKLDLGRNEIRLYIKVDQSPMLQKCVQPDYATNVTRKLLSALSRRQVRVWVLTVHLDDVISIIEICLRVLVRKLIAEEFWKRLHLNLVDG